MSPGISFSASFISFLPHEASEISATLHFKTGSISKKAISPPK
jgi:hypothetical protein